MLPRDVPLWMQGLSSSLNLDGDIGHAQSHLQGRAEVLLPLRMSRRGWPDGLTVPETFPVLLHSPWAPLQGTANSHLMAAVRRGTVAKYFSCIPFRWLPHLF